MWFAYGPDNGYNFLYLCLLKVKRFQTHGLEIQFPPGYEVTRTVLVRNVDGILYDMTEEAIREVIDQKWKIKKIVKISISSHFIKVILRSAEAADEMIKEGLIIHYQKFE